MQDPVDINLSSDEYFPKSINTKPKNDQGKSYSDRTDRRTEGQKDIENYNIDIYIERERVVLVILNLSFQPSTVYSFQNLYYNSQCLSLCLSVSLSVCPVAVTFALVVFRLSVYTFWKVLI